MRRQREEETGERMRTRGNTIGSDRGGKDQRRRGKRTMERRRRR